MKYYHNPRCTKSRLGIDLLKNHQVTPSIIEYLTTHLSEQELRFIITHLDDPIERLFRQKECKEAGIQPEGMPIEDQIKAIQTHPQILERPLLVTKTKAKIGRPPEDLLDIL